MNTNEKLHFNLLNTIKLNFSKDRNISDNDKTLYNKVVKMLNKYDEDIDYKKLCEHLNDHRKLIAKLKEYEIED